MPILMFRQVPIGDEPMLQVRYILEFPVETGIEVYYVRLKSKPSIVLDTSKVSGAYYHTEKLEWNPIEITYIDPIGPNNHTEFLKWINFFEKEHYDNYAYARAFKKNIILKLIDPVGVTVEKWTLTGCYLDKFEKFIPDFEDLQFTMNFDSASLEC